MAANRPRRQRKGDRMVCPGAEPHEIRCDFAIAPFDRLATDMARKWGVERLPELVAPATAERYGRAISGLNEAIEKNDPDECIKWAAVCIRGLKAMDAEAEANGAKPADPSIWEYELDGEKYGIVLDDAAWIAIKNERPELILHPIREAVLALKYWTIAGGPVAEVKKHFPSATVTDIRPRAPSTTPPGFYERGGDPIPFGQEPEQ